MKKPDFVYVTYIATTPEKVWQAIVDPSVAGQYWHSIKPDLNHPGHKNVSDWKPGSRWEHQRTDSTNTVDIAGKVVESIRPRRLVISWARPGEFDDESRHSRVTFEIEPQGDRVVRLTVMHEGLEADPKMLSGISSGWPAVLSQLKTFLESGYRLPPG